MGAVAEAAERIRRALEDTGKSDLPGPLERLEREVPAGTIAQQVERDVGAYPVLGILVDPHRGGAVGPGERSQLAEVLDQDGAHGISRLHGSREQQSLSAAAPVLREPDHLGPRGPDQAGLTDVCREHMSS
ncbi:MAG: hypothetical protein LC667_20075 [Thioalkalivibrio sp.]|nr:hypothetical protein [Thioalkalivibrio sp.]